MPRYSSNLNYWRDEKQYFSSIFFLLLQESFVSSLSPARNIGKKSMKHRKFTNNSIVRVNYSYHLLNVPHAKQNLSNIQLLLWVDTLF